MDTSFVLNGIQIEIRTDTYWLVEVVEQKPNYELVYHNPTSYCELLVLLRLTCKSISTIKTTNNSVNDVISVLLNNKNLSLKASTH